MVIEYTYGRSSKRRIESSPKNDRSIRKSIKDSTNNLLKYDSSTRKEVAEYVRYGEDSIIVKGESLSPEQWSDLLTSDTWLSSDHINAYLSLLMSNHKHIHAFPTYLYAKLSLKYDYVSVQIWTKKTCSQLRLFRSTWLRITGFWLSYGSKLNDANRLRYGIPWEGKSRSWRDISYEIYGRPWTMQARRLLNWERDRKVAPVLSSLILKLRIQNRQMVVLVGSCLFICVGRGLQRDCEYKESLSSIRYAFIYADFEQD